MNRTIMDSTSGYGLLRFLDAYSGVHQILRSREDEEHTAFITVDGHFCYVSMPYNLKNALPTFVRAMHKTFGDLIRNLVEVYVDDIVVKIKSCASLLDSLALVFDRLRSTRTKLNPDKCMFKVTVGKLLGFLVSYRGIKANLEKIKTIEVMRPLTRIKDVSKLMGCLAALSWFISDWLSGLSHSSSFCRSSDHSSDRRGILGAQMVPHITTNHGSSETKRATPALHRGNN
jgi:hypothetical protein